MQLCESAATVLKGDSIIASGDQFSEPGRHLLSTVTFLARLGLFLRKLCSRQSQFVVQGGQLLSGFGGLLSLDGELLAESGVLSGQLLGPVVILGLGMGPDRQGQARQQNRPQVDRAGPSSDRHHRRRLRMGRDRIEMGRDASRRSLERHAEDRTPG